MQLGSSDTRIRVGWILFPLDILPRNINFKLVNVYEVGKFAPIYVINFTSPHEKIALVSIQQGLNFPQGLVTGARVAFMIVSPILMFDPLLAIF